MKINLPIIFSQYDSRWGNILLGNNSSLPYNIYNYGCLLTSIASICRYFGKDDTPASLNEKLKENGGFVTNSGEYIWNSITKIYSDIIEKKTDTPNPLTDIQLAEIKDAIDAGKPVCIQIDVNPKTVKNDMHYVIITEYNPSDENDFTIADPLGGREHSLKDYLGWFRPNAKITISQYIIYNGPIPKIDATKTITIPIEQNESNVKQATQWGELVNWLELGNPFDTLFEKVQSVIGGYKSNVTTLQNKLDQASKDLTTLKTDLQNKDQEIANVKEKCQRDLNAQKALYNQLNSTIPTIDKVKNSYETTITELEGKLLDAQKEIANKNREIAILQTENQKVTLLKKIVDFIINFILNYIKQIFKHG